MQAVIVLPPIPSDLTRDEWQRTLHRKVSGIPLLERVLATARKAGVSELVIVSPPGRTVAGRLRAWLETSLVSDLPVRLVEVEGIFDANDSDSWEEIKGQLASRFFWLPWNFVTLKTTLAGLIEAAGAGGSAQLQCDGALTETGTEGADTLPAVVNSAEFLGTCRGLRHYLLTAAVCPVPSARPAGIVVDSKATVVEAERLLVRGSGKASDGIYSNFNRWLCRLPVRWLLWTRVSANAITLAGIPIVLLSGYLYSLGSWSGFAAGGLVYFLSVLLDEMDGMVARTRFEESAFGCWLETAVDYLSYLVLISGMAVGLSRQHGNFWLVLGGLTILANVLIFWLLVRQRKQVTSADHPEAYQKRFYGRLEDDSGNFVSLAIRKVLFLAKKGVMCHYILLFSVLGLLRILFGLVAFGSILTFFIVLYMNRLFRLPAQRRWGDTVRSLPVRR